MSDGGLAISSGAVTGVVDKLTGAMWTADTFTSDQYSQIEITSTQLTGSQWIGLAVRAQNGGQDAYIGIYYWNNGRPELEMFRRTAGKWVHLGSVSHCRPLSPGTELELTAVGSTVTFLRNGVVVISVSDNSLYGGAPGIMAYGNAKASDWSGGDALPGSFQVGVASGVAGGDQSGGNAGVPRFQATPISISSGGIESYLVTSSDDGSYPELLRVVRPTHPTPGIPHNFLYVLPVQEGLETTYGDGLETLLALNAQNRYNLTIIEPTFPTDPWYANNPIDPSIQYETFMAHDLVPWVKKNFAVTGNEQNWLIGFSKSGLGAQDLLLKHPNIFTLAASWDFPADMSAYSQFDPSSGANYGTDANFQDNYRLTAAFVDAHKGPFLRHDRIWIGGYSVYGAGVSYYNALLISAGIAYSVETALQYTPHRWDANWVSLALAALHEESINWSAST